MGSRDAGLQRVMTAPDTTVPDLGRFGFFGLGATPEEAQEIERLGYGTIWVGGSPPAELSFVEPLLESTSTLKVATGIVNIWTAAAEPVAESFHRINNAYPGRFVLGVGVGHPEAHTEYRTPYDALVQYLDELDEYGVPAHQRVLAALGPRVLKLSADRTAGAHPANATPEHAAQAREIIGPNALLAPVHSVVLSADPEEARATARTALDHYFSLKNYVSSWKRLGFTDADVTRPGSDKFIDAVVAHGTPDDIAKRLGEHLTAGANHVAILVYGGPEKVLPTLSELAGPLGLSR
jgi:probable F420-dependent oxidoreductase